MKYLRTIAAGLLMVCFVVTLPLVWLSDATRRALPQVARWIRRIDRGR